ncbi:MAG TPA: hydroxymethylbilane synthase, partial [Terriglobales bacterium]|nr:hydroxymethylbilane synthase [Terriglobales bacterium]
MTLIRIGSRGSQLALWQAKHVADVLAERGHKTSIEIIKTTGDRLNEASFAQVGTKGMFTKEIEEALAEGKIDLAVHSLKDLPTELPPGFRVAAVLEREDARDGFVSNQFASFDSLPQGARVGTSSLRREAQLRAMRPDLKVVPMRGNVDTRLRKLASGEFEAVILAVAGLRRLGKEAQIKQIFAVEQMCPAPGQGALAIEVRTGDDGTLEATTFLEDEAARAATEAERSLLMALGGGCQVPIGAHARSDNGTLRLRAVVGRPDGSRLLWEEG